MRFWSTFATSDCVAETALEHYESIKRYGVEIPPLWNKGYEKAYMPEHMPEKAEGKGLILLVTHELSLTGAPFILLEAGKLLLGMGWNVAMLSPTDGVLRSACLEAGIPVYVTNGYLEKLPVKADFCICNTFLMHRFYMRWRFELPVMWWIHEMLVSRVVCEPLLLAMRYAPELYVPSELTRKYLLAYSDNVRVLPQPLTDCGNVPAPKSGGKFRVAIIGSLCERKAQDVFIEAVRLLPERLKAGAEFEITGEAVDRYYARDLRKKAAGMPEVRFVKAIVDRGEYMDYVRGLDAVCCVSREDPLPTVVLEGLMHGKICIVSEGVGQASLITPGADGFVVPVDDARSLSETLAEVLSMPPEQAYGVQKAARALFECKFGIASATAALQDIIDRYTKAKPEVQKEKLPAVSIIIPVYNVAEYLPRCLDSVIAQTFGDWEAVCVDDGSTDRSSAILADYAMRDSRIRVCTQGNQGLGPARNMGMEQARGRYILFLDSDDSIHPCLLEVACNMAERHKAQMVAFPFVTAAKTTPPLAWPVDTGSLPCMVTEEPLRYASPREKWKIWGAAWSHMYRAELVRDITFLPIIYEDYPWSACVMLRRPRTVILQEPLYAYTNNPASISHGQITRRHIYDYRRGLESVLDASEKADASDKKLILRHLVPDILKQQFNRIKRSPEVMQPELWTAFAEELRALEAREAILFQWRRPKYYWQYRKLIQRG